MASSRSLGSLTLDLVLKAGAFTAGLDKAARDTNKRMSEIEKRAYAFGKNLGTAIKGGAVLATAALTAVAVAVGAAINRADEIRDLSIRIGVGTEALSEYAYAAKQTGTDIEGLGRGLKILSKNLAEAADPKSGKGKLFEALGVEVKDAAGNLKQLDVILPEIANKFKLLEDGTTKAALAQELFGKSGLELVEFLNLGSDGLDEMAAKARELGIVISEETAAAADQFNDKLADLRATADGFALELAAGLLPSLNLTAERFQELVKGGDLARNAISLFSGILNVGVGILEEYNNAVARTSIAMEFLLSDIRDLPEAYKTAQLRLDQLTAAQARSAAIAANNANLPDNFSSGSRRRGGATAADIEETKAAANAAKERLAIEQRLAAVMGGSEDKAKKKKSGGKSDAEKEAEKLKAAYDRLNESLTEQIALFGKTGEAVKLRYDLENGELSKLTQAEKDGLIAKAEKLDLLEKEKKAEEDLIKLRADQDKAFNEANEAILEQIELIGMTADEQEIYNNLTWAGVDAESARGMEIIANTEKLQDMRGAMEDQITVMDALRDAGSDFLTDWLDGSKSLKESLLDAWESVHQKILQMIAENLMDQLFGPKGDPAGGSSGDWLSSIIGAFTGGGNSGGGTNWGSIMDLFGGAWGFAKGGTAPPWSINQVNELGPEMATVNGKSYLMTGKDAVHITPNNKLVGGGGLSVTQVFNNPVMTDRRSDAQRQLQAGRELRVATRNS